MAESERNSNTAKCKVIAFNAHKGGCGKTTVTLITAELLTLMGYRVLLVDSDLQANLTMALGYQHLKEEHVPLPVLLNTIMKNGGILDPVKFQNKSRYILPVRGMDLIPSNINLAFIENQLSKMDGHETILKDLIDFLKNDYDFALLDCKPSLSALTVSALVAADSVLIPTLPQMFSVKGIELMLKTIASVRENLNPSLTIEGILVNMYDNRLKTHREVLNILTQSYGNHIKIFDTKIPTSVQVQTAQATGKSILENNRNGKVVKSCEEFVKEWLTNG